MGIPEHLMNFIGFGSSTPKFLFIGIEEWAPEDTVYSEFLERLQKDRSIVDLHTNHNTFPFIGKRGRKQATWWPICQFLEAHRKGCQIGDLRTIDVLDYQRHRLGRCGSNHLLTELFPVSKSKSGVWPQSCRELFGYRDLQEYQHAVWPHRMELLRRVIFPENGNGPEMICCYAKSQWCRFSQMLRLHALPSGDYGEYQVGSSRVYLLHHPNSREIRQTKEGPVSLKFSARDVERMLTGLRSAAL